MRIVSNGRNLEIVIKLGFIFGVNPDFGVSTCPSYRSLWQGVGIGKLSSPLWRLKPPNSYKFSVINFLDKAKQT